MKKFFALGAAIAVLGLAAPAFAQTATATTTPVVATPTAAQASSTPPAGLSSCFKYYTFGSVPVTLTPSLFAFSQGATAGFSGDITNNNPYPIDDAAIYAKVFYTPENSTTGEPEVVDSFIAKNHITLAAGESQPVDVTWKVPPNAEPGQYALALYVASSDRFELYGLTFMNDVVGSTVPFTVVGTDQGTVKFDTSAVTLAGQPFSFNAFPPELSSTTTTVVPVTAVVQNTASTSKRVSLHWQAYAWDSLLPSHLLSQSTKTLILGPGATTTVSYTVRNYHHGVYYVVGTITGAYGQKSIIGVRYDTGFANVPRFNFVGTSDFPAAAGKGAVVACIHTPGFGPAQHSKVVLTARTNESIPFLSRTIAHATWTGAVPQNIYALTAPFTSGADSFTVTASLYQNGSLVDQVSLPYDCTDLGMPCAMSYSTMSIIGAAVAGALILLIGVIVIIVRVRRSTRRRETVPYE